MSIKSDTEFIVLQLVIERTCTRASGNVMYPLRNKSLQRSHVVKKKLTSYFWCMYQINNELLINSECWYSPG